MKKKIYVFVFPVDILNSVQLIIQRSTARVEEALLLRDDQRVT